MPRPLARGIVPLPQCRFAEGPLASPRGRYGVHTALGCVQKPQLPICGRGKPLPYVTTKDITFYVFHGFPSRGSRFFIFVDSPKIPNHTLGGFTFADLSV